LSAPAGAKTVEEILPLVNQYCGACHAVPRPDVQPKRAWPELVRIMVEIMQTRSGKAGISEEQMKDITAFYYGSAPEELPLLPYDEQPLPGRPFVARDIGAMSKLPFVTNINVVRLTGKADVELLACDGESRELKLLSGKRGKWKETALAQVDVPVQTQVLDFDGDKDMDVLLADLGEFPPLNTPVGKLWLLRQTSPGKFSKELLLEKMGRTSDARAVDLDADGDLDIVTNEFNAAPMVLVSNLSDQRRIQYLNVKLVGTTSNRGGLGAVVRVTAGGRTYTKVHDGKSGYLSQSLFPLYFGLGDASSVDRIEVSWPSGRSQIERGPISVNSLVEVTEK
jgi:hypothetical protein